jgi:phosphohistidine swiveling domain-containing protein
MILFPEELKTKREDVGGKTLSLAKLLEYGFSVPKFVAVPANEIQKLFVTGAEINKVAVEKLVQEIVTKFPCEKYAVRSSALIEDSKDKSYAGQFTTEIDQRKEDLEQAIAKVITQAYEFLSGEMSKFSLIVQEYITADYAGVLFTRNPLGGREMVLEYVEGIGEELVSGKKNAQKSKFYWGQRDIKSKLPGICTVMEQFKKTEEIFGCPQDVEWCISANEWHFLQSRPITTISQKDYEEYLFADSVLPKTQNFIFEKTEISEIASRPTEITKDLLKFIYSADGPINNVYKKHKIKFISGDFLKIFGNELYVDREQEIKTLLPSYSYYSKDFKPHFASISGLFTTILNFVRLNLISLDKYPALKMKIEERLKSVFDDSETLGVRVKNFLHDYELIFEINLLAEKAIKRLENMMKNQPISCSEILAHQCRLLHIDAKKLVGNCLEMSDESRFMIVKEPKENPASKEDFSKWFNGLSKIKQDFYNHSIYFAQNYNELREHGRWLTVKHISHIRAKLLAMAEKKNFKDPRSIYFASFEELKQDNFTETKCGEKKAKYLESNKYSLPSRLVSQYSEAEEVLLSVSPGIAEGVLVDSTNLDQPGKKILFTKNLSPDLTEYFSKIEGILSENGGLLSHLAIMARENNVPVITNFQLDNTDIFLGDYVTIDAIKGVVYKEKK